MPIEIDGMVGGGIFAVLGLAVSLAKGDSKHWGKFEIGRLLHDHSYAYF